MLRRTFVVVLVGLGGVSLSACGPARKELPAQTPVSISREAPPPHARWKEVDQLIEDQKLEEASRIAEERLAEAKAAKDAEEWTRALVRITQLRMGLHGYETAVRFLREEPWPESPIHRVVLNLYYATTLRNYAGQYGWELRQRERVDTKGEVDLERWSFDQVSEAQYAALAEAWAQREALQDVPVTRFAEYVEPGTYPEEVRGTMRDALTYLLASALADSSAWTPAQSSGAYRVELSTLLGAGDGRLGDASVHPLLRMAAVLEDLERWHAGAKRRPAELEARLERVRLLSMHRNAEEDQAALRADLESRVPEFRDVPWFAAGKSAIALLWQNAGDLVKAREHAREGHQAYPESMGGKACLATFTQIEAPDFQLQAMAVDGLNRRSIQIQHRNLAALWLRAYPIDVVARLEKTPQEPFPDDRELRQLIAQQQPVKTWRVALPPTPDFQQHVTYDTPPFEKHGTYVIVASAREDFGTERNRIVATFMHVGALVLSVTTEPGGDALSVRVVRGDEGQAVAGATVEIREFEWQSRSARTSRFLTDASGYVGVERLGGRGSRQKAYFVSARSGDEVAFNLQPVNRYQGETRDSIHNTLVYTDRSVYRPQQTVQWKVVAYGGDPRAQTYRTRPAAALNVELLDPNGEVVVSKRVTTNTFGSVAGEFLIPTGRILGGWTLRAGEGGAGIQVEEYKRPTFEVTFPEAQAELRLNAPAKLKGEARYYFGLPVAQGKVQWTVRRVPRFPWWGWGRPPELPAEVIASGESPLRDDGTFEVAFTPQADTRVTLPEQTSYAFEVSAAVTDEGGETRSASRTTVLGFSAIQAQVTAAAGFFEAGRAPTFQILRSDLDGKPRAGPGRYRVVKLAAPSSPVLPSEAPPPEPPFAEPGRGPKPLTPGDKLSPRWGSGWEYSWQAELRRWPDAEQLADGTVAHDESGGVRVEVPALPAGAYRLHYETRDEGGNVFRAQEEFVVAGAPVNVPLFAAVEQETVKPGGKARLLITSGFPGQQVMVEIRRPQGSSERRLLTAGAAASIIEVPIGENDRGGVTIDARMIRDYQSMSIRTFVTVPFDHKELQLSFETFRDRIRPGAKETFRVRVAGPKGARVDAATAELLAYMYDKSLDYFAPHSAPSLASLYQQRRAYAWTADSLGQAQMRWLSARDFPPQVEFPDLQPASLRLIDDDGIGGMGVRRGMVTKSMPMAAAESRAAGAPAPPPPPAPASAEAVQVVNGLGGDGAARPRPTGSLRTEFSETAFFAPQLRLGADGTAAIEFTVPDSVTSWNVWVHALTRDLAGASVTKETRSVKELMVRPYLPRFLREGDEATLEVVLNSAAPQALTGTVTIELFDVATNAPVDEAFALKTRERTFKVEPGKSAKVSFALKAPRAVGSYGFRVRASAGEFADGEQRAIPVLPSRMRLAQSRFVPLREGQAKTMSFAQLAAGDDPSLVTEQLVVTVDAQLFYTALQALPYLVEYPYECTEQTLNRFVSTGILTSLHDRYPAVAKMAKQLSARTTQLEAFDTPDPNRRMLLEESPWLQESKGGARAPDELLNVLNPVISRTERESSIGDLRKMQQPDGAFPWFPGGPPSPYMTLYVMAGLARAAEYQVPVPKEVTARGWSYLAQYFRSEQAPLLKSGKEPCCLEFLTFLNFVASSYPDDSYMGEALTTEERTQIAEYTFTHWRKLSPYLKGMLALTLHRMKRTPDARSVFASVMDSAKTTEELGTYWAPEDRAWLWYNDTTESHAFALRVLMELSPQDARRHGLVQWLLLDKKLSHWKSTRATAEAIYALVKYLEKEGALGVAEQVRVQVAGRTVDLAFSPSAYTGKKNQIVIPGEEVKPKEHADVRVEKKGKGLAFASATWHFSTEKLPAAEQGDFFQVSRRYFIRAAKGNEVTLRPLGEGEALQPGDEVEVQLSIRSKHAAEYVHLQDPRAAGLEPDRATSGYKWDLGLAYYEETRDSATNFFFDWLPAGEYTLRYRVRASMAGSFRIGPATLQSLYAPEFNAYSAGQQLQIAGTQR